MDKLMSRFSEDDRKAIEDAVRNAEMKTSGEIVPMIVSRSSYVQHVPIVLALITFSIIVLALPMFHWSLPGPLWAHDIAALVISFAVAALGSRSAFIQRALTPAKDSAAAVFRRAEFEFLETGIPATDARTGVLIFVSLHEHRAVILGDHAISERMKPEAWVEILDQMIVSLRKNNLRDAFVSAIAQVGSVLEKEFPVKPGDKNELSNKLVFKD